MTMNIEIFSSPGCSKCGHTKDVLRKLAGQIGGDAIQWRETNILNEMDHTVKLRVLSTSSIAIDGERVFTRLPSLKKLRRELDGRLALSRSIFSCTFVIAQITPEIHQGKKCESTSVNDYF